MDNKLLIASLRRHEGERLKPYTDTAGKLTIGVGHNLTDGGISSRVSSVLLDEDIAVAAGWVAQHLPWAVTLDEVRYRALVELAFNIGDRLRTFAHMLLALREQRWADAARELKDSQWSHQVGIARTLDLYTMLRDGKNPEWLA